MRSFVGAWIVAGLLSASAARAGAPVIDEPRGYKLGDCTGTESKPQSKLWYAEGSWWCILDSEDGNRILRLVGTHWKAQAEPDVVLGGHDARADVICDGDHLIALLYAKTSQLYEFKYDRKAKQYRVADGYPVELVFAPGSETAVIAQDSRHRLWATYLTPDGIVHVAHSEGDHKHWNLPGEVLQDSVSKDDISTIIAFGGKSVGIMWSDQKRWEFGFRVHKDHAALDAWEPLESVFPGHGHSDDHVHLSTDTKGRLYAVTKDAKHRLSAHMRAPGGGWTSVEDVLQGSDATRPTLMTAEADDMLVMLYTRWHEGDEIIAYRTTPLGKLEFGKALPFISVPGLPLNNVTGTKQSLPQGCIVAIADGGNHAWWNGWGLSGKGAPWTFAAHTLVDCPGAALAFAFDERTGHEVGDSSENGARGRLGGPWAEDLSEPEWTEGVSGGALRYNGTGDFVEVSPAPQLEIRGSVTVEAWVRRQSHVTKDAVLCKGVPGRRTYQVRLLKDDQVEFLREAEGGKNHILIGKGAVADSLWHHVACVYDQEAHESRIYLDGRLDAAAPDSGLSMPSPADPLCIGARLGESDFRDWFHGDIDQVRITPGVRYVADFTPSPAFEVGPTTRLFLSWTPRFAGYESPEYDLFRSVDGRPPEKLNPEPLHATSYIDVPGSPGRIDYEVRSTDPGTTSSHEVTVHWPPVAAQDGRPAPH